MMKIAGSSVQMASAHAAFEQSSVKENVQLWSGNQRLGYSREQVQTSASVGVSAGAAVAVHISDAARRLAAQAQMPAAAAPAPAPQAAEHPRPAAGMDTAPAAETEAADDSTRLPPRLAALKELLERLIGVSIRVYGEREVEAPPAAGADLPVQAADAGPGGAPRRPAREPVGLSIDVEHRHEEHERMAFTAGGVVKTADGQEVAFSLQLQMERHFATQDELHVRLGEALKDPLVLSYPGRVPELTDTKFSFDLDGDGDQEKISFVKPSSGFLAFDRNGDGKVNDGRELFGTRSGDGFAELAQLDDDKNGWIDENDAAFSQLRLWTKDGEGQDQLQDLLSANVGAVSVQHTDTPFVFKDSNNQQQGVLRSSGVYLQEDGKAAGMVGQVDLVA